MVLFPLLIGTAGTMAACNAAGAVYTMTNSSGGNKIQEFDEFDYEKDLANLKQAIQRLDIPCPVDQDNDGMTWSAYHNSYWPTAYLIDKRGHIRFIQIGEGNYPHTEAVIQDLLAEASPQ